MTGDRPTPRRSPRDWAVDTCLFLFAVAYGVMWSVWLVDDPAVRDSVLVAHQIIAAVTCAALWLRRRWPVGLALAMIPLSAYADLATGAQLVALFTVAVHRPVKIAAVVGATNVAARSVLVALAAPTDPPVTTLVAFAAVTSFAAIGWGLVVRSRRQLLVRAAAEARLRAEQAQHESREQIAREMHDVLGHRLSLLSVHAGALEYHPGAPAEEVARAAAVIRESAHQALQELREVIGVLRAPVDELPQPTLADVPELVAESRRAGMRVDLRDEVPGAVPGGVGRTAYRIVQEGLTNARKHAPGADVSVVVTGAAGTGLTVEMCNPAADGAATGRSGPGQGLIGLAERTDLAGGRLEHGRTASGDFRLSAWLPWPS